MLDDGGRSGIKGWKRELSCACAQFSQTVYLSNQLPSSLRQPHSVHSHPGSPHPAHYLTTVTTFALTIYHSLGRFTRNLKLISFTGLRQNKSPTKLANSRPAWKSLWLGRRRRVTRKRGVSCACRTRSALSCLEQ